MIHLQSKTIRMWQLTGRFEVRYLRCSVAMLFLLLLVSISLGAQSSYVKVLDANIDYPFTFPGATYDPDRSNLYLLLNTIDGVILVEMDTLGNIDNVNLIASSAPDRKLSGFGVFTQKRGAYYMSSARLFASQQSSVAAAFVYNKNTGSLWGKQTALTNLPRPAFLSSIRDQVILNQYFAALPGSNSPDRLGFSCFDADTGYPNWEWFYKKSGVDSLRRNVCLDIKETPEGRISTVVRGFSYRLPPYHVVHSLLRLDEAGVPVASAGITGSDVYFSNHDIHTDGSILLSGTNNQDAFIARLDSNYNVLWAKRLLAEQFPVAGIRVKAAPDGGALFVVYTQGDLPVISGKMSPQGELLWYRGYPFFEPVVSIANDGALYFFGSKKYETDGSWEYAPVLAKTTPDGSIEGCPLLPACIRAEDMPLPLEPFEWVAEPSPPLPDISLQVLPATLDMSPHCGTPVPPSPYFVLPDTICRGACASPDSLRNRLAHYVQWRISGPALDTIIVDSSFVWCFETPGRYTIEQEVWLLGCASFHSRSLEVLPDLTAPWEEDIRACRPPLLLNPQSNRPLLHWRWPDGSTLPTFEARAPGPVALLAGDGYCELRDTLHITFVSAELMPPVLESVGDTTVCLARLPFTLRPRSRYAGQFFLSGQSMPDSVFQISQGGSYELAVEVEGCRFGAAFTLTTDSCRAAVFWPNAFSPNGDGINDVWMPLSPEAAAITLDVFDRWGGWVWSSTSAWDGTQNGLKAPAGLYVAVFRYRNLLSGAEEQLSGEVNLLR